MTVFDVRENPMPMRAALASLALVAALQSTAADYRLETVAENLTWPWCIESGRLGVIPTSKITPS